LLVVTGPCTRTNQCFANVIVVGLSAVPSSFEHETIATDAAASNISKNFFIFSVSVSGGVKKEKSCLSLETASMFLC
jgi:hypothetical protein